jgi:pilus assembly protein CpaE
MTIIVESDRDVAARLAATVGRSAVLESIHQVEHHLVDNHQVHVVVIGPSVALDDGVRLAEALRISLPAVGIILVRESVDTAVLADALRSGMREVVPLNDLSGLGLAVRRAHELALALLANSSPTGQSPLGKVVTVFSAKGGVGKTTISTNLAVALAADGAQVCLVDLDLAFGDVAIALQIYPTRTIADAIAMQGHLDSQGLDPLLTFYRDGVYALAAPVQPDLKDAISARLVHEILESLRERFAYIVIDTPPAFDEQVLQAFDESDLIVLIATPDIPALKNLKVACETINQLNIPHQSLRVVLNRADSRVGISSDEVAASLQMKITTSIPSSRDVPTSVNRGELLFLSDPRHPVSQAIGGLAHDAIIAVHPAAASHVTTAATSQPGPLPDGGSRKRRGGLFSRRVGS